MADNRSRFAQYRDRQRGGPPRKLKPCGTWAAAQRHKRKGEPLCAACKEAQRQMNAEQYRKRKARQAS